MNKPKTDAERKAKERQIKRESGLTPLEIWAHPDHHAPIKAFADSLKREKQDQQTRGKK